MDENVALDTKKQKKFDKSIKGIKKLLKKDADKPHMPAVLAPKDTESEVTKNKKKHKENGLVYLSHIPHGFYEHEMTQYFKQFGMVTNVRVIRSPRTGRSKGYAFVEFREPEVAEIVAETMNNYLMGKRLIKAAIIPPEKQRHKVLRKHWNSKHNPTADRRVKERKAYNAAKTDEEHLKKARKMLSNLQKTKKKLSDMGIDYDFFTPVDVPEPLLVKVDIKAEIDKKIKVKNEPQDKQKKNKKTKAVETKVPKDMKTETINSQPENFKNKKEAKKAQESAKSKQNDKQKKMQDAGMKLPENFIKVGAESGEESDSSIDFDSDEYEKMLENDSAASSGDESEDDDNSDDASDDEEEEESDDELSEDKLPQLVPIKEKKSKKTIVALPPQPKVAKPVNVPKVQKVPPPQQKKPQKPVNVPKADKGSFPQQQAIKRKNLQSDVSPKKPKFEKKNKKPKNKQFKKKNKAQ